MSDYKLVALRFDQVVGRNSEGRAIDVIKHRTGSIVSDLDELEARRLLKAGAIVPVDIEDDDDSVATDAEAAARAEAARIAAEQEAARLEAENARNQAQGTGKVPPRPKVAAAKPLWEAYASARGVNVDGLDKDEIIVEVDKLDAK